MHPSKVNRQQLNKLTDLPNIGKAGAEDLRILGIDRPDQLVGKNPFVMYQELCLKTAKQHDPCVVDVFISIIDFMNGGEPRVWWHYSEQRKCVMTLNTSNNSG